MNKGGNLKRMKMTKSDYTMVFSEDMLDMAKLCQAGLAQDSPEVPYYYLNQLLNYVKSQKYGLPHECGIQAQPIQNIFLKQSI